VLVGRTGLTRGGVGRKNGGLTEGKKKTCRPQTGDAYFGEKLGAKTTGSEKSTTTVRGFPGRPEKGGGERRTQ